VTKSQEYLMNECVGKEERKKEVKSGLMKVLIREERSFFFFHVRLKC
jgi:hypothetical protein